MFSSDFSVSYSKVHILLSDFVARLMKDMSLVFIHRNRPSWISCQSKTSFQMLICRKAERDVAFYCMLEIRQSNPQL